MNKAFVREPDDDGRRHCPRCESLGVPVQSGPLDRHVRPEVRSRIGGAAWFCSYPPCAVAYFDGFLSQIAVDELLHPVYPKDPDATLCECFGFSQAEIDADLDEGTPVRIRALLQRSQSSEARCASHAPDGRCCLTEIKRIYMKERERRNSG